MKFVKRDKSQRERRKQRHRKVRMRVEGSSTRPRMSVYRSNTCLYVQLIDDDHGHTMLAFKGVDPKEAGKELAKMALAKHIKSIVFDRGGFAYAGKIKLLAESAREHGLRF